MPHKFIEVSNLMSFNRWRIAKYKPAIIFPDSVDQILPDGIYPWLDEYLANGGNIAVIFNAGVRNSLGNYLNESVFINILGLNHITYTKLLGDSYTLGHLKFKDDINRDYFEIPLGRVVDGNFLSGYKYGAVEYPVARNEIKSELKDSEIYASTVTKDGGLYPAIVLKNYRNGKVLYVNLPLGYAKAYTDDLPLRAIIRTFLFKELKIPHLVNTPYAKGGLVWNWHVDDNREWENARRMKRDGFMRKGLKYSFHITAGEFTVNPQDKRGFDVCGRGRKYAKIYKRYGIIGSHGGWRHDWFASNIRSGKFGEKEIEEYISKNNDCFESITKYKITEYSAPLGVHPQPTATKILEKLGVIAYYYTGDMGSSPNRTFINGKMVTDKVITFPLMPFGKAASFWELEALYDTSEEDVKKWLIATADYAAKNRVVRLMYTHPYDLYDFKKHNYQKVFGGFLDHVEELQKQGRLQFQTMTYFAEYLLRFLKTDYAFRMSEKALVVSIKNPNELEGIYIAIPRAKYKKPEIEDVKIEEDDSYYYLIMEEKENEMDFHFDTN